MTATFRKAETDPVAEADLAAFKAPTAAGQNAISPARQVPALELHPHTTGMFADFAPGKDAAGVRLQTSDPPSSHWIDQITQSGAGASLTYDNTPNLPPIPTWIKCVTTAAVTNYASWLPTTYPKNTDGWGREYLFFLANPPANIRFATFGTNGGNAKCHLRVNSSTRKIEVITAAGSVISGGTSSAALAAGTPYLVRWHRVHNGTAGTIRVFIYNAATGALLDDFTTAAFDNGAYCDRFDFFSWNNTNMGGVPMWFAAPAEGCPADPGVYTGQDTKLMPVIAPDGTLLGEIDHNGEIIRRATRQLRTDLGHAPGFLTQPGTPVVRIGEYGVLVGENRRRGNPLDESQRGPLIDIFLNRYGRRIKASSIDLIGTDDPSDITQARAVLLVPTRGGTGAATTAQDPLVTLTDAVASNGIGLTLDDEGCAITIDGIDRNILRVKSPTTCTVDPPPTATVSGKNWTIYSFPYADKIGQPLDSASGQLRWLTYTSALVRSGTGLNTTAGNPVTGGGVFTQADVGRRLLINGDYNLAANAPGKSCFKILSVDGSGNATLDAPVPGPNLTNVPFMLAKSNTEGGSQFAQSDSGGFKVRTEADAVEFGPDKGIVPIKVSLPLAPLGFQNDGAGGSNVMVWYGSNGKVEVSRGDLVSLAGWIDSKLGFKVNGTALASTHLSDVANLATQTDIAGRQPLDSDLTAIAALSTTAFGRSLLAQADAAAARSTLGTAAAPTTGTHAQRLAAAHVAGRLWKETDTGLIYLDDGTNWIIWKGDGHVRKTADETVNNSATLQNDDHLFFPIEANEVWFVEAFLLVSGASATADFQFGWSAPTGATAQHTLEQGANSSWSDVSTAGTPIQFKTVAQTVGSGSAAFTHGIALRALIVAGANPGTVNLQWSQNTQTAEDNKVLTNSILRIRRLV